MAVQAHGAPRKIPSSDEKLFQAAAGAGAEIERHHHDANAVNGENDPVEGCHKLASGYETRAEVANVRSVTLSLDFEKLLRVRDLKLSKAST